MGNKRIQLAKYVPRWMCWQDEGQLKAIDVAVGTILGLDCPTVYFSSIHTLDVMSIEYEEELVLVGNSS